LSDKSANALRDSLAGWVSHARKVGGRSHKPSSASTMARIDNKSVRKWAEANGVQLSSRGRIPADVVKQYRAAGN
jgi:hypothetical protein